MENGWKLLVTLVILSIEHPSRWTPQRKTRRLGQEFCLESFPFDCLLDRCVMEESSFFSEPREFCLFFRSTDIFPSISPFIYQQLDIIYIYSTSWIYTPQNEALLTSVGDLTKAVKAGFVKTWLIYICISGKMMFKSPWSCFFSSPACSKQNSKDICEAALGDAVPRKSGDISR